MVASVSRMLGQVCPVFSTSPSGQCYTIHKEHDIGIPFDPRRKKEFLLINGVIQVVIKGKLFTLLG